MAHMVPIFKTGTHKSREGHIRTFTTNDLDSFVSIYNGQAPDSRHDATAVIGHPKTDGPAYGWFNSIKRDGELLYGELRDEHPEFVQWVKDGRYRKVSAKFDADGLLKHVGWLGAQPPAIKGLPEFNFEADGAGEEYDLEFSEDEINDIDTTTSTSSEADMDPATQATQQTAPATELTTTTATAVAADGSIVSAQEFAEYKAQREAEFAELRNRNQSLEFSKYLDGFGITRVTPAMRPVAMNLMKGIDNLGPKGGTFEFAEGDVTVSGDLMTELKKLLEMITEATSTEEVATDGEAAAGEEFSEADNDKIRMAAGLKPKGGTA